METRIVLERVAGQYDATSGLTQRIADDYCHLLASTFRQTPAVTCPERPTPRRGLSLALSRRACVRERDSSRPRARRPLAPARVLARPLNSAPPPHARVWCGAVCRARRGTACNNSRTAAAARHGPRPTTSRPVPSRRAAHLKSSRAGGGSSSSISRITRLVRAAMPCQPLLA